MSRTKQEDLTEVGKAIYGFPGNVSGDAVEGLFQCCDAWNIFLLSQLADSEQISAMRIRGTFSPDCADRVIGLAGAILREAGLPDGHMTLVHQVLID